MYIVVYLGKCSKLPPVKILCTAYSHQAFSESSYTSSTFLSSHQQEGKGSKPQSPGVKNNQHVVS